MITPAIFVAAIVGTATIIVSGIIAVCHIVNLVRPK